MLMRSRLTKFFSLFRSKFYEKDTAYHQNKALKEGQTQQPSQVISLGYIKLKSTENERNRMKNSILFQTK